MNPGAGKGRGTIKQGGWGEQILLLLYFFKQQ